MTPRKGSPGTSRQTRQTAMGAEGSKQDDNAAQESSLTIGEGNLHHVN